MLIAKKMQDLGSAYVCVCARAYVCVFVPSWGYREENGVLITIHRWEVREVQHTGFVCLRTAILISVTKQSAWVHFKFISGMLRIQSAILDASG